ncbi:MAG: DUF5050 domain-containing protein [Bacteroides sp.]|nr:DUF5050 domain-containing protein [Eubacterium sp.]MCM1418130.1 DUF5050 domain-containing protein [Roseburia sp.]MCM1462245.1 DUF5050 domain-containing protein [Bacteroides sp.]
MRRRIALLGMIALFLSGCSLFTASDQAMIEKIEALTEPKPEETIEASGEAVAEEKDSAASASPERESGEEIAFEPFRGVGKDETPLDTINYKDRRPAIVCADGEYTYISWDGVVYRYNEAMTSPEPLFEKNAYDLNYRDGGLYFIEDNAYRLNGNDIVHQEGVPYRYDLSAGTFRQLSDRSVASLFVCDEGIFFTEFARADDPLPSGVYRLDEGTGNAERLYDGYRYLEYGGYTLRRQWGEEEKVYFSDGDRFYLLEGVQPEDDRLCGDYYYYRSTKDGTLSRLSMLTGETLTLQCSEEELDAIYADALFPDERDRLFFCADYTVFNGELYFADLSANFYRYDEAEGAYTVLDFERPIEYLYTDEKTLYAALRLNDGESYDPVLRFAKLTVSGTSVECEVLL